MTDIILMNLAFWSVWIPISHIPQYLTQKFIDKYPTK